MKTHPYLPTAIIHHLLYLIPDLILIWNVRSTSMDRTYPSQ